MPSVDEGRYSKIQGFEFEFWQNNVVDFQNDLWANYMKFFAPHVRKRYHHVVDVGCGPMPFFLSGYFGYDVAVAVDPLIYEYALLPRYAPLYGKFQMRRGISEVETGFADVVFALNVLDHVRDTDKFLPELARICRPKGELVLFVDVNKPPDHMHPHTISTGDLCAGLSEWFDDLLTVTAPSWKFNNMCLWYVGRRKVE